MGTYTYTLTKDEYASCIWSVQKQRVLLVVGVMALVGVAVLIAVGIEYGVLVMIGAGFGYLALRGQTKKAYATAWKSSPALHSEINAILIYVSLHASTRLRRRRTFEFAYRATNPWARG